MSDNLNFTQIISFRSKNPEALIEMSRQWDEMHAEFDVMGYMSSHLLVDREDPEQFLMIAEFGVVDPDVSAAEEAEKNNARDITNEWYRKMIALTEGEPKFHNYDEIYRTG